ncbi:nuclear transport factor 2 family protein [Dyadobacter sp. CY345]|uniref:nuclear transport factor 2 family protein n=1 Tax=Dyadobacter sp. CY345 TaxID=2909335 RepID=UPI001F3CD8B5|nr:nuclear transport factor 2 family protein [Dyadobacter sp. CY345]MCF2444558.1 nuclear transport factor 2 family protein [Dyadobacter sp. CY345]
MKKNIIIFIFLILIATSFKLRSKTPAGILNSDSRVFIEHVSDTQTDNKIPVQNLEEQIRTMEMKENEALRNLDTTTLYGMWSPDLVVNTSENKIQTLADLKTKLSNSQVREIQGERVIEKISITENVAVVMGHEIRKVSPETKVTSISRFTNMWLKDADGWKLTARQTTVIDAVKPKP